MKNIILVLIVLFAGLSSNAQAQVDEIEAVVTEYLEAYQNMDFDSMAEHMNPKSFEVRSKREMKKRFLGFLNSSDISVKMEGYGIKNIAPIVDFENSLYSTVTTSQKINFDLKEPVSEKEKSNMVSAFKGMFGPESTKKVGNRIEVDVERTLIMSKAKDERWFLTEYDEKMFKQSDIDAVTPKGAQKLLSL